MTPQAGLSPQLQFSDVLTKWRRFFHQMAAEQGKAGLAAKDTRLEVAALQVGPGCRLGALRAHCPHPSGGLDREGTRTNRS